MPINLGSYPHQTSNYAYEAAPEDQLNFGPRYPIRIQSQQNQPAQRPVSHQHMYSPQIPSPNFEIPEMINAVAQIVNAATSLPDFRKPPPPIPQMVPKLSTPIPEMMPNHPPPIPQTAPKPTPRKSPEISAKSILNFDQLMKNKNPSKDPKFAEMASHLTKTKFKPLGERRRKLVNNEYLSDIKFVINNEKIYGHKLFIVTSSARFYEHFCIKGNEEMKIEEEIDKNVFLELIAYCYTGQLKINEENVLELLLASKVLKIQQITNLCSGFIDKKINPDTIFVIFEKAIQNNDKTFEKKCLDFITKNEEKCFESNGFFNISLTSLMMILNACQFTTEKSDQLIAKWTTGGGKIEEKQEGVSTQRLKLSR